MSKGSNVESTASAASNKKYKDLPSEEEKQIDTPAIPGLFELDLTPTADEVKSSEAAEGFTTAASKIKMNEPLGEKIHTSISKSRFKFLVTLLSIELHAAFYSHDDSL